MTENTDTILAAYVARRAEALALIASFRRSRKFGIYGVMYRPSERLATELAVSMARFLLSHLQICADGEFGEGNAQDELMVAICTGHPLGKDVETLIQALYPVSTHPAMS
jgi:hypothetical protein